MYFGLSYMWSWDCERYYFFFFINPHSLPLSFIIWSPLSYYSAWFSFVYFSIFFPFLPSLLSFCIVHPSCAKTRYISQISYPYWFCPGLRYNTHAIGTLATKWVQNVWFNLIKVAQAKHFANSPQLAYTRDSHHRNYFSSQMSWGCMGIYSERGCFLIFFWSVVLRAVLKMGNSVWLQHVSLS